MAFEKFISKSRGFSPIISINTVNMISFNKGVIRKYNLKNFKYSLLFFDKDTRRIGIKFTNDEKEEGIKNIRHRKYGGADIAAKSFLDYYDIKMGKTTRYIPEYDDDNSMLIIDLTKIKQKGWHLHKYKAWLNVRGLALRRCDNDH